MTGYWYIEGPDGRRYCWRKEPSYRCPIASATRLDDALETAALRVGIDSAWLLRKIAGHAPSRRRIEGKLTDICDVCGHRLVRLGFRYWIEAQGGESTNARLAAILGGDGYSQVEGPWYAKTKRDAQAWAHGRVHEAATA